MKFAIKALTASLALACATGAMAQKGETVKVAWIDPLSGLMAALGSNQLKSLQYIAEELNKGTASGVKFEIIGIDNKLSPQETTAALRSAMDQRSEEHTSELQSPCNLVCRLLLEKKTYPRALQYTHA